VNQVRIIKNTAGCGLVGARSNYSSKQEEGRWASWVDEEKNGLLGHRKEGNDIERIKPTWELSWKENCR
jgi:hypothetical protein